jgi:hypothetical protein
MLGVGGRVLMRAIALATGTPAGFSLGGSLEVVAAGALYGALSGALLPFVPARLGPWRSAGHAAGLFILIALTSDAARGAAASIDLPARILALLPFGALLLVYSMALVRLTSTQRPPRSGPAV